MASPIPSNIPAKDPGNSPPFEKATDPQPPSYALYEVAQPYPGQPYPTLPHFYVSPTQQQHQQPGPRKRSVTRRFFTAFAFAVTIWALMNVLVHSIQVVTHFNATFVGILPNIHRSDAKGTLLRTTGLKTKTFLFHPTSNAYDVPGAIKPQTRSPSGPPTSRS